MEKRFYSFNYRFPNTIQQRLRNFNEQKLSDFESEK